MIWYNDRLSGAVLEYIMTSLLPDPTVATMLDDLAEVSEVDNW